MDYQISHPSTLPFGVWYLAGPPNRLVRSPSRYNLVGLVTTVSNTSTSTSDFNTAYHAILGRLALAKFMVVPHYAYLVLKMPSLAGVLALRTNLSIAYAYEKESLALDEATDLSIQMASVVTDAKTVPADDLEIPSLDPPRASTKSKETKEVGLGLDDPSKTVKIGAHLDTK